MYGNDIYSQNVWQSFHSSCFVINILIYVNLDHHSNEHRHRSLASTPQECCLSKLTLSRLGSVVQILFRTVVLLLIIIVFTDFNNVALSCGDKGLAVRINTDRWMGMWPKLWSSLVKGQLYLVANEKSPVCLIIFCVWAAHI